MVCHLPPFVSIDLNPLVVGTNDATIIIKLVKAMESSCGFVVLVAVVVVAVLVVVVQRDNVAVEAIAVERRRGLSSKSASFPRAESRSQITAKSTAGSVDKCSGGLGHG